MLESSYLYSACIVMSFLFNVLLPWFPLCPLNRKHPELIAFDPVRHHHVEPGEHQLSGSSHAPLPTHHREPLQVPLDRFADRRAQHPLRILVEMLAGMPMPEKTKETVSVRLDREHRKELDKVASRLERDRSYIVNEAVGSYLARLRWEEEHVKESLREARAGKFATDEQVEAAYAAFGSPRKA